MVSGFFFLLVVFLGAFFLLNVILVVIISNYSETKSIAAGAESRKYGEENTIEQSEHSYRNNDADT